MRSTIDKAGRLVIPKALRGRVGLRPGSEVEITVDGAGLRLEPLVGNGLEMEGAFLVIPSPGFELDDESVRELRFDDQR